MSIQDSTQDPYSNLRKHAENMKPGEIIHVPQLVDKHGVKMNRSEMSGKEVQDMRKMKADVEKARSFTARFETFASISDDGIVRLYIEVVTKFLNGHEYRLAPMGYTKEQLKSFIEAIQTVEGEILLENIKAGSPEGSPESPDVGTPGDPVQP